MSVLFFFSSDHPLEEIENPHYKYFSINEVLERGIEVPEFVLNSETINRNKPNVILWSDLDMEKEIDPVTREVADNGIEDDFSIYQFENFPEIYTEKQYHAEINWDVYSEGRAKHLVEYIHRHMKAADEMELWHVWLTSNEIPAIQTTEIKLEEVDVDLIKKIDELPVSAIPTTHYCCKIKK